MSMFEVIEAMKARYEEQMKRGNGDKEPDEGEKGGKKEDDEPLTDRMV